MAPTSARGSTSEELLDITGLSKAFSGQLALDAVDLQVRAGEILALAGPNGSGKSTLIKVMAGYHKPDGGTIHAFGQEIWPNAADRTWEHRVHFIHQVLALIPTLSAAENIALGSGYRVGRMQRIRWREQVGHAEQVLARFGIDCDVTVPIVELSAGERTVVAVARALDGWEDPSGLLFVDEPTASLHAEEAARLFRAMRSVADAGAGVVFVSHRSEEVLGVADRVAVLRDGRLVAAVPTSELDEEGLVTLIAGRRIAEMYPETPSPQKEVVLTVRELAGRSLAPLDFDLHRGEILGIAGLNGSGRDELPGLLYGTGDVAGGTVELNGRSLAGTSIRGTIEAGLVLVPADRAAHGVVLSRNVRENMTLPSLGAFRRRGRLSKRAELAEVDAWIERLDIQPPRTEKPVEELSGGNQQKVVMAKWLRLDPQVIILDEPTQGVDVAAKAAIYELLGEAAGRGASLIVCSSEAKPLAALCDRVIVLRGGRVASILQGNALTEEAVVSDSVSTGSHAHDVTNHGKEGRHHAVHH